MIQCSFSLSMISWPSHTENDYQRTCYICIHFKPLMILHISNGGSQMPALLDCTVASKLLEVTLLLVPLLHILGQTDSSSLEEINGLVNVLGDILDL